MSRGQTGFHWEGNCNLTTYDLGSGYQYHRLGLGITNTDEDSGSGGKAKVSRGQTGLHWQGERSPAATAIRRPCSLVQIISLQNTTVNFPCLAIDEKHILRNISQPVGSQQERLCWELFFDDKLGRTNSSSESESSSKSSLKTRNYERTYEPQISHLE